MTAPISCAEAVHRLWAFLDRELAEPDETALEAHLAYCRLCCGELEFARELRRLLRCKTGSELPEDVHARLDAVIDGLDDPHGMGADP